MKCCFWNWKSKKKLTKTTEPRDHVSRRDPHVIRLVLAQIILNKKKKIYFKSKWGTNKRNIKMHFALTNRQLLYFLSWKNWKQSTHWKIASLINKIALIEYYLKDEIYCLISKKWEISCKLHIMMYKTSVCPFSFKFH